MPNENSDNDDLIQIIEEFDERLQELDSSSFSTRGFRKLKNTISDFISSLIYESYITSLRHNEDVISEFDVETANRYLVAHSKKKKYKIIGDIGGILFGASIGAYISLSNDASVTEFRTFIILGSGLLGVFLMAVAYSWDI